MRCRVHIFVLIDFVGMIMFDFAIVSVLLAELGGMARAVHLAQKDIIALLDMVHSALQVRVTLFLAVASSQPPTVVRFYKIMITAINI
jgi:hypothetical protein